MTARDPHAADRARCRSCKWSTTAHGAVGCLYSENHEHSRLWLHYQRTGTEDPTTLIHGVGCLEYEPRTCRDMGIQYGHRMIPIDTGKLDALIEEHGEAEIVSMMGYQTNGCLYYARKTRRMRRDAAERILERTGVNILIEK